MGSVTIFGGCCSRDSFNYTKRFSVKEYFARSSLFSVYANPPEEDVSFESVSSRFQKRMVEGDVKKTVRHNLLKSAMESDLLLMDFLTERLDLIETPSGGIITKTPEVVSISKKSKIPCERIIEKFSDERLCLFRKSWEEFFNKSMQSEVGEKIVLNKVFLTKTIDAAETFGDDKIEYIERANAYLSDVYSIVEEFVPEKRVICYRDSLLVANSCHRWGVSPFHFCDEFYYFQLKRLSEIMQGNSLR